jgi:hypothetical protein
MKFSTKTKLISAALVAASLVAPVERNCRGAGRAIGCGMSMSRL